MDAKPDDFDEGGGGKYNPVTPEISKAMRPGFLGGEGGGEKPVGLKGDSGAAERNNGAAADLGAAEAAAAGGLYNNGAGAGSNELESARGGESQPGGLYTGKAVSAARVASDLKKGKIKGVARKAGPIGVLVALIMIVGGLLAGSQSFQLFAWVANINLDFGQSSAVINRRANYVLKKLLSSDAIPDRDDVFGKNKYKITDELRKRFQSNGIDIVDVEGTDGKNLRVLVYGESDGTKIPVVVSESDLDRIPGSIDGVELSERRLTFDQARSNLQGFRQGYDTATIAVTGRAAGWFDSLTDAFLKRVGGKNPRNKLGALGDNVNDEDVRKAVFGNVSKGSDDINARYTDDGQPINNDTDDALRVGNSVDDVKNKMNAISGKALSGSNAACMALRAAGTINAVAAGTQLANVIDYTLKILEVSDKTRAGDGNNAINIVANMLNTPTKSVAYDATGNEVTYESATTESKGWNATFSNTNIVSENDPGAMMVNRENVVKNAMRSFVGDKNEVGSALAELISQSSSVDAFRACLGIQAAGGIASFVSDVVLVFTTAGIGNVVKAFLGGIFNGLAKDAVMTAMGGVISIVAPMVARWLVQDLSSVLLGEVGGYALHSGAHIIHNGNLQMSAGMNASREQAIELYGMTREVEKDWIAYERSTLSPFDISSRYTFMGNLAYSLLPVMNKMSHSAVTAVPAAANLLGGSIAALSGEVVNAASDTNDFKLSLSSDENCPYLAGVGVAGDAYCNRYSGAYMDDLVTLDSLNIYEGIKGDFEGVDADGNPRIKTDSNYAKYIVACNLNDAQPGEMSAVVQGFIEKKYDELSGGTVAGNILVDIGSGFIPFSGAIEVFDAKQQADNIPWNDQEVCSDPKYRLYSDYSVDQRVLEDLGIIKKSAVTAFVEEYYEENPLDNSFEGVIARYSGLSKEEVRDTLDIIEYINYVANYDASERYAFGVEEADIETNKIRFELENVMGGYAIISETVIYADVRNQNYVA